MKPVTVRFPTDVYEAAKKASQGEDSFNTFVTESVKARIKQIEDRALYDSFTKLGEDAEESNVDFVFEAQAEIAKLGD